jgi:uncharacterized membrane protein YhaH (DUF805 family)
LDSTSSAAQTQAVTAMMAAYGLFFVIFFVLLFVLQIVIGWKIASKAGYNGALSLLLFVPFVNFIIILIFAFSEWPIQRQLRAAGLMPGMPPGLPPVMPPGTGMMTQ